jgi:hypothetical protein
MRSRNPARGIPKRLTKKGVRLIPKFGVEFTMSQFAFIDAIIYGNITKIKITETKRWINQYLIYTDEIDMLMMLLTILDRPLKGGYYAKILEEDS